MNLESMASFKARSFSEASIRAYDNVIFFYYRRGSGDTRSFWRIDNTLIYEDHKGDRHQFLDGHDPERVSAALAIPPPVTIDTAFFLFNTDDNPGHTFSSVLKGLYYYKLNNLECQVVVPSCIFSLGEFLKSLIYELVPRNRIITLDSDIPIMCKTAFIYRSVWIYKQEYLGSDFGNYSTDSTFHIEGVHQSFFDLAPEVKYLQDWLSRSYGSQFYSGRQNVCLLKTSRNISTTQQRAFDHSWAEIAEERGFKTFVPEGMTLKEIYLAISSARKIVTSWGAISFINKIFFHPEATVLFLCHTGYQHEYKGNDWHIRNLYMPVSKKISFLFDLESLPTQESQTEYISRLESDL